MIQLTEVQTSTLTGPALAWAVGTAEGLAMYIKPGQYASAPGVFAIISGRAIRWKPEEDWSQTGPLIEKHNIQLSFNGHASGGFCAYVCRNNGVETRPSGGGRRHLTAALRAIVASKFPNTVRVPLELAEANEKGGAP